MRPPSWASTASTAGLALLLLSSPASAQSEDSPKSVQEIIAAYQQAHQIWIQGYGKASKAERAALMAKRPRPQQWYPRLAKFFDSNPASKDAYKAAAWVIQNRATSAEDTPRVLGILRTHHVDRPEIGDVCGTLAYSYAIEARQLMRAVLKQNKDLRARALTTYALASYLRRQASFARRLKTADEAFVGNMTKYYGRETIDVLRSVDPGRLAKEAEGLLDKVVSNEAIGGVEYRRGTLADVAKNDLFEIRNLAIGKVAPEIVGEDLDGATMKLSDYRGKVVVLDFWGDW